MAKPAFSAIEKLFHQAVALPIDHRSAFVDTACSGDAELRAAVMDLLRHDATVAETSSFLNSPLTQAAAVLRPTIPIQPVDPSTPNIPGYHILGILGRGGMGVVYMARQASLKRIVALKMLQPAGATGQEQLKRFRSEAELLARIHQPNIVPIYDIGECDGRPYFTMEFVDGPTLSSFLAGRPQEAVAAARFVEVLARAIQSVHEIGIVHRDLKPANVLLARNQAPQKSEATKEALDSFVPKISDFGLATEWNNRSDLTKSGVALGTPSYMAPEQTRSRSPEVGPPTDVYALGAILYEMLTGRPPFDAATPAETLALVLRDDPLPPARLRAGLPRDLNTICLKCLEKSPRSRYATAAELADELQRYQSNRPIRARPAGLINRTVRWSRRHPLAASLAAFSTLLLIAFLVTVLIYDYHLRNALAREQQLVAQQRDRIIQLNIHVGDLHVEGGDSFAGALQLMEAMRNDAPEAEGKYRARLKALLSSCPTLIEVRELNDTVYYACATTRGILAATFANEFLTLQPALGDRAPASRWVSGRNLKALSACPDGRWSARVDHDGKTAIVDEQSSTTIDLPSIDGPAITKAAISKGATAVITTHADDSKRLWTIANGRAALRPMSESHRCMAISSCGHWLITVDDKGEAVLAEVAGNKPSRKLQVGDRIERVLLSADATLIVTVGQDRTMRVWRTADGVPVAIPHVGDIAAVGFDDRGEKIVVADTEGVVRVWSTTTGRPLTPRLYHAGPIVTAEFQTVGQQLAVVGRKGNVRVWQLAGAPTTASNRWSLHRDDLTNDQLVALLQILAHRRIDEAGQFGALAPEHVRAAIDCVNR